MFYFIVLFSWNLIVTVCFNMKIIKDMWMFVRELGEEAQSTSSSSQTMAAEKVRFVNP